MHPSSLENMQRCLSWYGPATSKRVVDIGGASVNGSYRDIFVDASEFLCLDLQGGPSVDIVLDDPYRLPFPDESVDVVISGQMLEHCAQFWRLFTEIARVLKPEALFFIIAPSAGPIHRYPVDCYRFYPDAYQALADWSGLRLVHCWHDERGPWRDLVGVFQKGGTLEKIAHPKSATFPPHYVAPNSDRATEALSGQRNYLDVLADMHKIVNPRLYLEIGIRKGRSLALASCKAIGIDPGPELEVRPNDLDLYTCTSDDFFFFAVQDAITAPVDLAFIDGMHLAEYVYRDFMNLERFMSPSGVIVIDDVLPNHPLQAARDRQTQAWTGDVWRFPQVLAKLRPDLKLTWLDTEPTGLLVVSRLDSGNTVLSDRYNPVIRQILETPQEQPPAELIERTFATAPSESNIRAAVSPADPA
ncbi:methyltransferase domain-containing protein [Beijerinckia indica]|uniref:Methyltransferase type 11 n=1 Tax=Beijerinckia indica subsp. indica (strain ATCC 9039 / DSM 1715 / NCIMB 8712) TaxID=395963 RepID=B2IDN2_BEII9|nr:methyltransferase domain-containing protein [Beijerinckia indica]ACB95468.1 Methyltransferase type 11 [Beijerinckia indica subsp. indica ATCC 9039]